MKNLVIGFGTAAIVFGLCLGSANAGNLEPPAGPSEPAGAMFTLRDIYQRLASNTVAIKRTGGFAEPATGPTAGTMRTLDEIYALASPTQLPTTGQTNSWSVNDDGASRKGVAWPTPRYVDHGNGTVTDNLTGLMWTKDAGLSGRWNWGYHLGTWISTVNVGGYTDWRIPNAYEMFSVFDLRRDWTNQPPFVNILSNQYYWTSTSFDDLNAYRVYPTSKMGPHPSAKTGGSYTWPVRGGR